MQADLVVFGWAELMAFTGNSLSLKMTAVREPSSEIFIVMASASYLWLRFHVLFVVKYGVVCT